jgi:hypothetical protein
VLVEKDGLREEDAADPEVALRIDARVETGTEPVETVAHLHERRRAIRLAVDVPDHGERQPGVVREKPEACNGVVRRLELEEEGLAGLERRARRLAGTPEVDLVDRRDGRSQESVPVVAGVGDEAFHWPWSSSQCLAGNS